jgi:hypothetical protein
MKRSIEQYGKTCVACYHASMKPEFSTDWLSPSLPAWEQSLAHLKGRPNLRFLEIGSFEGRSACWLLQHILTHPTSTLTCVDPFEPFNFKSFKHTWPPPAEAPFPDLLDLEKTFDENIRRIGGAEKVIKEKGESSIVLRNLPLNSYDCIYIDGSHLLQDVLMDAVLSWELLRVDGILIFDDYLLMCHSLPYHSPRIALDAFLACFNGSYELISLGWQLIIRKTKAKAAYTPTSPVWQHKGEPSDYDKTMNDFLTQLWGRRLRPEER